MMPRSGAWIATNLNDARASKTGLMTNSRHRERRAPAGEGFRRGGTIYGDNLPILPPETRDLAGRH